MIESNIFLYWQGRDYILLKILRDLIKLHLSQNFKIHYITPQNLTEYVSIPKIIFDINEPALIADYIRVKLIQKYGGIWLDADTLVMNDFKELIDMLTDKNGFFIIQDRENIIINGVFASKKETPLMNRWSIEIDKLVNKNVSKIKWADMGNLLLDRLYKTEPELYNNYLILEGKDNVYPINWRHCEKHFINRPYRNFKVIKRDFQPFIILVNSVYKSLSNESFYTLLSCNKYPLTYFLKQSFENLKLISNKNKKYVIVADWLVNYITLEHFKFCCGLESFGWQKLLLSKLENINIEPNSLVLFVTYDSYDITKFREKYSENTGIKIVYKIDDIHPYADIRQKCLSSSDYIISPYQYHLSKCHYKINCPTFWIPYSAVDNFYGNIKINTNPKLKVLVSGISRPKYPFRNYVLELAKTDNNFETLQHPGYNPKKYTTVNDNYYKKISEYLCAFTDNSEYDYILLKVFEIASVGTLLLVSDSLKEQMEKLCFVDGVNCIMCNRTNISDKVNWILDSKNRIQVDKMRKAGIELVRDFHNTSSRCKLFNYLSMTM